MDFASTQEAILASLVSTTRSVTRISAEDIPFHRSLDPSVASSLDRQNIRLLSLVEELLRSSTSADSIRLPLPGADSIDSGWRTIVDVVDGLLEKADTSLDEFAGLRKPVNPREHAQVIYPYQHVRSLATNKVVTCS